MAILTLAIGIGTTTAVFTIVNGVLLQPLPYRNPSRLVILYYGHQGRVSPWFSPLNLRDYVGRSSAFAGASAVEPITVSMTGLCESGAAPGRESLVELLQRDGCADGTRPPVGLSVSTSPAAFNAVAESIELSGRNRRVHDVG